MTGITSMVQDGWRVKRLLTRCSLYLLHWYSLLVLVVGVKYDAERASRGAAGDVLILFALLVQKYKH